MRFISADKNSFYFNPRPREEGDIMEIGIKHQNANFNPRPREEGDAGMSKGAKENFKFQSTPS